MEELEDFEALLSAVLLSLARKPSLWEVGMKRGVLQRKNKKLQLDVTDPGLSQKSTVFVSARENRRAEATGRPATDGGVS